MAERKPEGYLNGRPLHPESLMMSYGYRPEWSEGAAKIPIFQTSTFIFKSAEEGKAFFELAYGLRSQRDGEQMGLIYSRLNNPDLEILEDRLTLWDDAEAAAVFASGMAAITTTLLTFLRPGDLLLHSEPVYGGTDFLFKHILPQFGIRVVGFRAGTLPEQAELHLRRLGLIERLALIFIETPANPTNDLVDIAAFAGLARRLSGARRILTAVDNTFLGPLWQQPLRHGADLVIYSATKYIGGHSDVLGGAVVFRANDAFAERVRFLQINGGAVPSPFDCWLTLRGIQTLAYRVRAHAASAMRVARFLATHPRIERVHYPGLETHPGHAVAARQMRGFGGMISIEVQGGEAAAMAVAARVRIITRATSLGGVESLIEHRASVEGPESVTPPNLLRISVGLEHPDDLIADLAQALEVDDVSPQR